MTMLSWYDPSKKPAREKVIDAMRRYAQKFGKEGIVCLTNPIDARELAEDEAAPDIAVKGMKFVPRHTFMVGQEDA